MKENGKKENEEAERRKLIKKVNKAIIVTDRGGL
jgi:hypothetical protein